jgi:predicted ATPase/transcriptional regulator with XRE-family HTH domain
MDSARPDPPGPIQQTFGTLLRRYRLAAGISQERLAEQAGLSVQALSALENGRRRAPYRHTVALLARAMRLSDAETAVMEAAVVRTRAPAGTAPPAHRREDTPPGPTALTLLPVPPLPRSNLPVQLTSFIGRERERCEVRALLDAARLVTLTGSGGVGKTRLALAVAEALADTYPEGAWLVDLAPLVDPALLGQAVAQTLGLREELYRPLLATLVDQLRERHLLLVLDNCEHLVGACAELAMALLQGCPAVRILATSREGLGVPGERLYRVPSLAVPPLGQLPPPSTLGGYAAVALFVVRAQERQADFVFTAQNASAVAQLCVRLDGMPLAIELAAARVGSLPVAAIATRLDHRFKLLTAGPRMAVRRQQTLRATMDWSYDLLSKLEQFLLQRLSVFTCGCTLDAAEAVCCGGGIEPGEVLDLLGHLVNKSLVLLEEAGQASEAGRYRLLETVRQYGQERLEAQKDAATVHERHATYFLALAVETEPYLIGQEQWPWRTRLAAELDNLRAALRWFLAHGAADESLQLAVALDTFCMAREGYFEGKVALELALALPDAASSRARARALVRFGWGMTGRGDTRTARHLLEEAQMLGSVLEDRPTMARALLGLGMLAIYQGDYPRARAVLEESLVLYRPLGDSWGRGVALCHLAQAASMEGDHVLACTLLDEALALARATGEHQVAAMVLEKRGEVAFAVGDHAEARRLWVESLNRFEQLGLIMGIVVVEPLLGRLALRLGDHAAARTHYQSSLQHQRGWLYWAIQSVAGLAAVAIANRQPERALRLAGAAIALSNAAALRLPPPEQEVLERAIETTSAALDERTVTAAWAAGRAMTLEEAIAEARDA